MSRTPLADAWHRNTQARWLAEDGLSTLQIARRIARGRGAWAFVLAYFAARSFAHRRGINL